MSNGKKQGIKAMATKKKKTTKNKMLGLPVKDAKRKRRETVRKRTR